MAFSSIPFLFAFLPIFLVAYYVVPRGWRNATALAASLLFYSWGAPQFLVVLAVVSAVDYLFSRRIAAAPLGSRRRRTLAAVAISLNLALLAYFKYANFAVHQANLVLGALFHAHALRWTDVV